MEYKGINEAWEEYKENFQQSVYMQRLSEKQRERDFRQGYMRGFESGPKYVVGNTSEFPKRELMGARDSLIKEYAETVLDSMPPKMREEIWDKELLEELKNFSVSYPLTEKKKVYEYKGNQYTLKGIAEMKNPETRKWQRCHIYKSVDSGIEYVRESEEFLKLFKEVK
jgi:hypothetical protein